MSQHLKQSGFVTVPVGSVLKCYAGCGSVKNEHKSKTLPVTDCFFIVCRDLNTAERVAFDRDINTKCVTLDGDVISPGGDMSGGAPQRGDCVLDYMFSMKGTEQQLAARQQQLAAVEQDLRSVSTDAEQWNQMAQQLELRQHELELGRLLT